MDEHQPHEPVVDVSPTRRSFYIRFIFGAMSTIGAALAVPAAIYLLFPPKAKKEAEWFDTTDLSALPVGTPTKIFLYEDIPASSGWHQIIGSMAVFFFVIQVFTGGLLAFNYAPTPGDAYNSVKYIVNELTAGKLIRGLHHWGASMMLIIVVLH